MFLDYIAEGEDKSNLVVLAFEIVYLVHIRIFRQELLRLFNVFTFDIFERRSHYILNRIIVGEQLYRRIHVAFEVAEADYLAKSLFLVQHTICAAESL